MRFTVPFRRLASVSLTRCNPSAASRRINSGRGGGVSFVSPTGNGSLRGWAIYRYHMSAPDRLASAGEWARAGIRRAAVTAAEIEYSIEGQPDGETMPGTRLIQQVFGDLMFLTRTNPYGTRWSRGAIEARLRLAMKDDNNGKRPAHLWDGVDDRIAGIAVASRPPGSGSPLGR